MVKDHCKIADSSRFPYAQLFSVCNSPICQDKNLRHGLHDYTLIKPIDPCAGAMSNCNSFTRVLLQQTPNMVQMPARKTVDGSTHSTFFLSLLELNFNVSSQLLAIEQKSGKLSS